MGAVFSWVNALERAGVSITATSEAAGLGVQSVLTTTIADIWRTAAGGAGTRQINVDLGSARPLRAFAAAAPRDGLLPGAGATWRIRVSNVAIGNSEVLDSGPLPSDNWRGTMAFLAPAAVSGRYLRFSFTGVAGDPYLQLGRLWAGEALVTNRNPAYGWQRSAIDAGSVERAPVSGVSSVQRGAIARVLSFDLKTNGADADAFERIDLEAGLTGQMLISPFEDMARALFGRLAGPLAPANPNFNVYTANVAVQESL
jgi:hypothetical protein